MAKKQQQEPIPLYQYPQLNDGQLETLDRQLDEYRVEREVKGRLVKVLLVDGELKFMAKQGAIELIGPKNFRVRVLEDSKEPCSYQKWQDKFRQLYVYKGRKEKLEKLNV